MLHRYKSANIDQGLFSHDFDNLSLTSISAVLMMAASEKSFATISQLFTISNGILNIDNLLLFSPNDHFATKRAIKWEITCLGLYCWNYHDFMPAEKIIGLQSSALTLDPTTNQAHEPIYNLLLTGVVNSMSGCVEFEHQSLVLNRLNSSLVLEIVQFTRNEAGQYIKSRARAFQGAAHLKFEKIL